MEKGKKNAVEEFVHSNDILITKIGFNNGIDGGDSFLLEKNTSEENERAILLPSTTFNIENISSSLPTLQSENLNLK